jgi:hypothetical protein
MLPESLQASTSAYLEILDTQLPGHVTGAYAVGSAALGDYRERISNLDLIVVTDRSWPAAALDVAVGAQNRLDQHRRRPAVVAYATTADLAHDPSSLDLPCYEGRHRRPSDRLVNPMTWGLLTNGSIGLRGSADPSCFHDNDSVSAWATAELQTNWRPGLSHPWTHLALWRRRNVSATVLELARLSVTAATGTATSKTDGATAIRARIPGRFKRCLDDAAGYRSAGRMSMSLYWGPWERKRDVTALLKEILTAAGDTNCPRPRPDAPHPDTPTDGAPTPGNEPAGRVTRFRTAYTMGSDHASTRQITRLPWPNNERTGK